MADKKELLTYGMVNSRLLKQFDIDAPVLFAEIHWPVLVRKAVAKNRILYTELPKFPEVKRDLALLVDKATTFAQIRQTAMRVEKKLLRRISLFDVYEGKNLPEGKKSYAVSFTLLDETKTLNDKQIDKIMQNLIAALGRELNATLR